MSCDASYSREKEETVIISGRVSFNFTSYT